MKVYTSYLTKKKKQYIEKILEGKNRKMLVVIVANFPFIPFFKISLPCHTHSLWDLSP